MKITISGWRCATNVEGGSMQGELVEAVLCRR
jgi:hypothetical protein